MSWLLSWSKNQKSEQKKSYDVGQKSEPKKSYDVYLSFCGKDTGELVSRLYNTLYSKFSVNVLWDKERLKDRDRVIKTEGLNAIEECKIAIIVFSRNYANSRCCLQELEKITKCCQSKSGLVVLIVFYFSFPSSQCLFGKAFYDFVERISTAEISEDKFMSWVVAITKASIHSIHVVNNSRFIGEVELDPDVVRYVTHVLHQRDLSIADYPLGVRSRVQDVIQLLNQSEHLLVLGIWGMIGIGKSTIARYIYHLIGPYFEDKSFVDFGQGECFEKKQIQYKRVLVILDGVTKSEELDDLNRRRGWFGQGSRIIITTRDRHLLKEYGVDHIYKVKVMDQSESLEVFNRFAFKKNESPEKDYAELSRQFVAYTGGWPLALSNLGSSLCGKDILTWKDDLSRLKRHPNRALGMQRTIESSLEDLNDKEREIFFDTAYFFIGMNKTDLLDTLARSTQMTLGAASQIIRLEDKSHITFDENNSLEMHVVVQGTAREIIERELTSGFELKTFDVFVSFRGEDGRFKFISHLHSSFQNAAIYVFKDDEIQRGDQISTSLFRAIGRSRICIVVLSRNYANSRWCMLELERIMKNHRIGDKAVVVPVFYGVDPSEVRKQTSEFGKAFDNLISSISVDESMEKNWRRDLHELGSIAGFVILDSGNESADINNIVRHVTLLLDRMELFVAEHPVGVESRVQIARKLLNIKESVSMQVGTKLSRFEKPEQVKLLGIWGMGGMGKTTVAKAIYNQIGKEFEGRSFLFDIRETWEKYSNRGSLQQLILCDIYKTAAWKIHDIESGKVILRERLGQKRVLVVLDDVNKCDQLEALCGNREWFGPGSIIIITTRDIRILRSCGVDEVYEINKMEESESLELFSWHAFKQASPKEDFATHSRNVVTYSGGLPLALQVLGSYLFDRGIKEWKRLLEKLKRIPNDQVQEKLKLSFDGLSDDTEKQTFLDIACFFIGQDKNMVIEILNGCDFFADIGVDVLIERSLVTVDDKNKLRMHDLLKSMGREIVRQESPYDPEKRSRLWLREEVLDILSKDKGTENVKGLALELARQDTICLNTKKFEKMNKLRLLQLAGVKLDGDFKHLSGDLRWLCWHGFPLTSIPEEFQQRSLVSIELKYSNLTRIWRKSQMQENVKILNLSHSQKLTTTPDFRYLPNLEKLVLKDCPMLSVVCHTIGSLHKLLLINLTDCKGLRDLPRSIYTLKRLETLILSGCLMIEKLEEDLEQMESLITLIADRTGIKKVPFSIVRSKNIGYISLCGFKGFPRNVFPSLIRSWMSPTNNELSQFHTSISSDFPYGIFKDVLKLRSLCVECDSELQLTQVVARILNALNAAQCQKLDASTSAATSQISDMYASPSNNYWKSLLIQMGMKCQITNMVEDRILQSMTTDGTGDSFLLPCDNGSDWLTFSSKGCSTIFEVPKMKGRSLKRMMLGIDYSSSDNITSEDFQGVLVMNYTKTTIQLYKRDTLTSFEDEEWLSITANLEPGNKVEIMIVFGEGLFVEKTSLSLLYDEPNNKDSENSDALNKEDVIVSGYDVLGETSNPPVEENWDDGKEKFPSQNRKGKSIVVQTSKSKTTMTSTKKGSETNTFVKDSSAKQTEKQKLSLPKNLKIKHSGKPLLSSAQPENTDILSGSSNSNLSNFNDLKKRLDIDPLEVMDQLLLSEVATPQTELFSLEAELEKLRQLAFSDKLFAELPNNQDLQSAVKASIQYIQARHKDLNSQQFSGISAFSKLFNKAIVSINAGNIVSHQLSQLAFEEIEAMTELQSSRYEIKQEAKRMAEIEAESRQIGDEIATLQENLGQEKNVLEDIYASCKVKHEEAVNKGMLISLTVISIREKIEEFKNQERENNAKYAELSDSYERMKASPPF